jgi:tetratricopeptide (TPR) repeat protein
LRAIREYGECFTLYAENIRIHSEKLGEEHPQTLRSLSRLANTYYAAGRYEDAKPMFEDIFERRVRVLGGDHPDTLRSRSSLANTLAQLGQFTESAGLHEENIEDRVRVLGSGHVRTELSRRRLDQLRQFAKPK